MFADHQPAIAAYARESDQHYLDTFSMVLLSINREWWTVGRQLTDLRQTGIHSRWLFGSKRSAYDTFVHDLRFIREKLEYYKYSTNLQLALLTSIPGISLAKAGFFLTLLYGTSGCLDRHNLRRLDLPESLLRTSGATYAQITRRTENYQRAIFHAGGTETLWNDWCSYMALTDPLHYPGGAEQVSAYHIQHLQPELFQLPPQRS